MDSLGGSLSISSSIWRRNLSLFHYPLMQGFSFSFPLPAPRRSGRGRRQDECVSTIRIEYCFLLPGLADSMSSWHIIQFERSGRRHISKLTEIAGDGQLNIGIWHNYLYQSDMFSFDRRNTPLPFDFPHSSNLTANNPQVGGYLSYFHLIPAEFSTKKGRELTMIRRIPP